MITLFGRSTQEWTIHAMTSLKAAGWKYNFVPAESCNNREYNEQGIKTVPTLKIKMANGIILNAEGLEAIQKMIPADSKSECSFRFLIK